MVGGLLNCHHIGGATRPDLAKIQQSHVWGAAMAPPVADEWLASASLMRGKSL